MALTEQNARDEILSELFKKFITYATGEETSQTFNAESDYVYHDMYTVVSYSHRSVAYASDCIDEILKQINNENKTMVLNFLQDAFLFKNYSYHDPRYNPQSTDLLSIDIGLGLLKLYYEWSIDSIPLFFAECFERNIRKGESLILLGKTKNKNFFELIKRASVEYPTGHYGTKALGEFGGPEAAELLMNNLLSATAGSYGNESTYSVIGKALGMSGSLEICARLIQMLNDGFKVEAIVQAFVYLKDPKVVEPLINLAEKYYSGGSAIISGQSYGLDFMALVAEALANQGNARAIPVLNYIVSSYNCCCGCCCWYAPFKGCFCGVYDSNHIDYWIPKIEASLEKLRADVLKQGLSPRPMIFSSVQEPGKSLIDEKASIEVCQRTVAKVPVVQQGITKLQLL